jgi:hypothetical protein
MERCHHGVCEPKRTSAYGRILDINERTGGTATRIFGGRHSTIAAEEFVPVGDLDWLRFCAEHRLEPSMSRRGNCWDNAVAESFKHAIWRKPISSITSRCSTIEQDVTVISVASAPRHSNAPHREARICQ